MLLFKVWRDLEFGVQTLDLITHQWKLEIVFVVSFCTTNHSVLLRLINLYQLKYDTIRWLGFTALIFPDINVYISLLIVYWRLFSFEAETISFEIWTEESSEDMFGEWENHSSCYDKNYQGSYIDIRDKII